MKYPGWLSWDRIRRTDPTLVGLSVGHAITHWYPSSLYVILPYLAKDMGLTYGQVGMLMAWNSFSSFFVNLPGGMIVDMVGKTGLLLGLAMALIGLPYFFLGLSASYAVALIVVTFIGIGNNLWHPAALSVLAKRYPDRKGFSLALHTMGGNVGNTLAPLAIGIALGFLGWRHVLILSLIPGVLLGLLLWRMIPRTGTVRAESNGKELSAREYGRAVKAMAKDRSILLVCSLSGIRGMTQQGLFTFLPIYVAHDLHYSPAFVGIYLTILQSAGVFSSPLAGVISDRKGRRPVLTAGLISTSLLLVGLGIFKLHFLFVGALAVLGFFLFSLQPVLFAWAMDLAPAGMGGTTVSALFGIQSLLAGFAPAVCGFIADRYGIMDSFYFLAATIFAANFLVYLIPDASRSRSVAKA